MTDSNIEKHRKRHVELHKSLDELVANWITHTDSLPSKCTVMELMKWSYSQTISPDEE